MFGATVRLILAALGLLALAACAQRYVWHKEGAGRAGIEQAQSVCWTEAGLFGFLDGPTFRSPDGGTPSVRVMTATGERYSDLDVNTARREAELFDDCMRKLGYARVPVEGP